MPARVVVADPLANFTTMDSPTLSEQTGGNLAESAISPPATEPSAVSTPADPAPSAVDYAALSSTASESVRELELNNQRTAELLQAATRFQNLHDDEATAQAAANAVSAAAAVAAVSAAAGAPATNGSAFNGSASQAQQDAHSAHQHHQHHQHADAVQLASAAAAHPQASMSPAPEGASPRVGGGGQICR